MLATPFLEPPEAHQESIQVQFDVPRGLVRRLSHVVGWGLGIPFLIFLIVAIACSIDPQAVGWGCFGFGIAFVIVAGRVYRHLRLQQCTISSTHVVLRRDSSHQQRHNKHQACQSVALSNVQDVTIDHSCLAQRQQHQQQKEQVGSVVIYAGESPESQAPVIKLHAVKDPDKIRELILRRSQLAIQRLQQQQPDFQVVIPIMEPVVETLAVGGGGQASGQKQEPDRDEEEEDNNKHERDPKHSQQHEQLSAMKQRLAELEQTHSALEMHQLRAQIADMEATAPLHQLESSQTYGNVPQPIVLDPSAPSDEQHWKTNSSGSMV